EKYAMGSLSERGHPGGGQRKPDEIANHEPRDEPSKASCPTRQDASKKRRNARPGRGGRQQEDDAKQRDIVEGHGPSGMESAVCGEAPLAASRPLLQS